MKDLTKIYIDLSKCTEEQRKHIEFLTGEEFYGYKFCHLGQSAFTGKIKFFGFNEIPKRYSKSELTYSEFIKLFEGGEDNNGWIKIGEDGKINYNGLMWGVDKSGFVHYFSEGDFIEIGYLTHYQPIVKPLPPKF